MADTTNTTPADNKLEHAERNARAGLANIVAMVAALECDYERLEELRELKGQADDADQPLSDDEAAELAELEEAAGECNDRDDAEQRIYEDPLSIEVRSGWYSLGGDTPEPEEFCILLTTGGPALRIVGELDSYGQPGNPRLEYQDWFTPWTELVDMTSTERAALQTYCEQFYFGD